MRSSFLRSAVVLMLALVLSGFSITGQTPQQATTPDPNDAFKALLGTDDGAGLVVLYGGDTRGNIDTCG